MACSRLYIDKGCQTRWDELPRSVNILCLVMVYYVFIYFRDRKPCIACVCTCASRSRWIFSVPMRRFYARYSLRTILIHIRLRVDAYPYIYTTNDIYTLSCYNKSLVLAIHIHRWSDTQFYKPVAVLVTESCRRWKYKAHNGQIHHLSHTFPCIVIAGTPWNTRISSPIAVRAPE